LKVIANECKTEERVSINLKEGMISMDGRVQVNETVNIETSSENEVLVSLLVRGVVA
jgi:hypothetical protein